MGGDAGRAAGAFRLSGCPELGAAVRVQSAAARTGWLTLAHQHLSQVDLDVRAAVIGNAGSLAPFRLGAEDAKSLSAEIDPGLGYIMVGGGLLAGLLQWLY